MLHICFSQHLRGDAQYLGGPVTAQTGTKLMLSALKRFLHPRLGTALADSKESLKPLGSQAQILYCLCAFVPQGNIKDEKGSGPFRPILSLYR